MGYEMTTEKSKNMKENKNRACPSSASSDVSGEVSTKEEALAKTEERSRKARLKGISQEKAYSDSDQLSQDLVACNASVQEWKEKYMRLSADLENFKRRIAKEQQMWREMAQADLLLKLLTIIDNFDRAMEHKDPQSSEEIKSWMEGIAMIYGSFGEFLKSVGVKEVPCKVFDPSYHDALMQVDSDEHKSGAIVMVMEKGYMLGDRVIRPARVSVAK